VGDGELVGIERQRILDRGEEAPAAIVVKHRGEVSDARGDVDEAVPVEIPERDRVDAPADLERDRRPEGPVPQARPDPDADAARADEIDRAAAAPVAGGEGADVTEAGDWRLLREGAIAVSEEDADHVEASAANRDVGLAVSVEV